MAHSKQLSITQEIEILYVFIEKLKTLMSSLCQVRRHGGWGLGEQFPPSIGGGGDKPFHVQNFIQLMPYRILSFFEIFHT